MGWLKIDDKFPRHPKIVAGGIETSWFYTCALAHCAEQLTDGFVANGVVNMVAPHVDYPKDVAERCADLELFERVDGGYLIPNYTDYNPSREEALAKRAAAAKRKAKQRAASKAKRDRQRESQGESRRDSHGDGHSDSHGESHPPRPVPSRPVPVDGFTTSQSVLNSVAADDPTTDFEEQLSEAWARKHYRYKKSIGTPIAHEGKFRAYVERECRARLAAMRDLSDDEIQTALRAEWPICDAFFDPGNVLLEVRKQRLRSIKPKEAS